MTTRRRSPSDVPREGPDPAMEKAGIVDEFDAKADIYDTWRYAPMYHAHNDFVHARLGLSPSDHVVDIGCGAGYLLRRIVEENPGVTGLGVDISPRMAAAAERASAGQPGLDFEAADWEAPTAALSRTLKARPPTVITCASVLHYFADPQAAFARMHAALRPGGRLFVFDRRKDRAPLNHMWDLLHRHVIRDHVRFYHEAEIAALLEAAGLREADVIDRLDRLLWKKKFSTHFSLIRAVR